MIKRRLIENLLDKLGVQINQLGYKYLICAVELKVENGDINIGKIYRQIANEYKKKVTSVERAIRYVRLNVEDRTKEIFNVNYKIDNGNFIALLAREIERNNLLGDVDEMHSLKN